MALIPASRGLGGGRLNNVELELVGILDNPSRDSSRGFATHTNHYTVDSCLGPNAGTATASTASTRTQNNRGNTVIVDNDDATKEIARVGNRVDSLDHKLHGVIAKSDERAISFAGLGFESISESNAWLEAELSKPRLSGLIVDAHMVFGHVYHSIEEIDTITTMEKLCNTKVLSIAGSIAMTLFDSNRL
jgi:hypothetical protein